MSQFDRRDFLAGLTVGTSGLVAARKLHGNPRTARVLANPASVSAAQGAMRKGVVERYWINSAQSALPSRPWRKIHLDFHNSKYIDRIGEDFDADRFGDTLAEANIDSIVVFAKDMHGYFYYPSRYGPVHPGLSFDLLGKQVAACRERDIEVYAYYCTTWDNYLAYHHPEWLVFKRDRTTYLPKFDETPRWTALCLSNEGFVELMLKHIREFLSFYELDGPWLDMPVPIAGECFCSTCLEQLKQEGLDPFDTEVQREHKHRLHKSFIRRVHETAQEVRPGCQVDFNGQTVFGLGERIPYMDNVDIEALPTAFWGYYYFPTKVRYVRTFPITTYGMTGRFQASWADFGGLKLPVQLHTELASIVANGARCDIGDQMNPRGHLEPAIYKVIGKVYERIASLEPYLEGAVPVSEAAIVTSGYPLDNPASQENYGLVKILMESQLQFDVVEPSAQLERYALLVLSDDLEVDKELASRLKRFEEKGGALWIEPAAALLKGTEESWIDSYGFSYSGPSPFKPAYMTPRKGFIPELPAYPYALYEGATRWKGDSKTTPVAVLGEPAFQRNAQHYTSHAQTPFDHQTEFIALGQANRLALSAFPVGLSYYRRGYWVYRRAFQHLLKQVLPARLVESSAPMSAEITLTHQKADTGRGRLERFLVHIVNFSALRKTPDHPVFYEDPSPLFDVSIRLNLPHRFATAGAVNLDRDLELRQASGGGVEVSIPEVPIHEIVAFNVA